MMPACRVPRPGGTRTRDCRPRAPTATLVDVTDQQLHPVRPTSTASATRPAPLFRSGVELLLGLSFFATMAFAGMGAAAHRTSVLAEVSGAVFVVSLMVAAVQWFRMDGDSRSDGD
jgi:hypothetical protein